MRLLCVYMRLYYVCVILNAKEATSSNCGIIGFFWVLGLRKRANEMWLVIVLSILLSIGYACFDEFRQVFHPGRSGMMADVILDSAGACVGITLAYIVDLKKWIK